MSTTLLLAAALHGQAAAPPDLSGTWTPDVNVTIVGQEFPCVYQGTVVITQSGNDVTGPVDLTTLVSGPDGCPTEMSGTLAGVVSFANLGEPIVTGTSP